jgi:hypothetical protein
MFVSSSLTPWGMAFKVKLYLFKDECSLPKYHSPLSVTMDDTFATLEGNPLQIDTN